MLPMARAIPAPREDPGAFSRGEQEGQSAQDETQMEQAQQQ